MAEDEVTELDPGVLKAALLDDALKVLGLSNILLVRSLVRLILNIPVGRLARVAARFDRDISALGLQGASKLLLRDYVNNIAVRGLGDLPREGPLLLLSNHPAAYDLFVLAALLPRDDLKVVVSEIVILHRLPAFSDHLIFIGGENHTRMAAARSALRHLRQGGALLVFASGTVDPDPDVAPGLGLSIDPWYESPALFIRRAPETKVVLSIVSGILSRGWFRSPVTLLRRRVQDKQKVAEIFQLVQQLFLPGRFRFNPRVSFAGPMPAADIIRKMGDGNPVELLFGLAEQELAQHISPAWQPEEIVQLEA